jgi:glycopeptide antibiotics resistance protein
MDYNTGRIMDLDSTTFAGTATGTAAALTFNQTADVIVTATLGAIIGFFVTELLKYFKKKLTKNK